MSYRTISANNETVEKEWLVIDATGHSLGRLASQVALLLRGKHKPYYTPHVDCGDNVIIINAEKAIFTGNKAQDREYKFFSGYPGGLRRETPERFVERHGSAALVRRIVQGMLPKNRLARQQIKNLYVYEGAEHKHEAQQPRLIEVKTI